MQDQEQYLMNKYTLKINNKQLENEFQEREKNLQRKALFPIMLLYQLGYLINFITKNINGMDMLDTFVDLSTNLSLFFVILSIKVNRFNKYSHIAFMIMSIIMTFATWIQGISHYVNINSKSSNNVESSFNGFYLGATLFGIILGPSFAYRISLCVLFSSIFAIYIAFEKQVQRPLTGFIVVSHFTLYCFKIYQEEKQKREFYLSTCKVNFWENIIQNVLLINLIVVKFDKKSQRLVLEKSNKTAMSNIKVKNDEDLQHFLENTKIKKSQENNNDDTSSQVDDNESSTTKLSKGGKDLKQKYSLSSKAVYGETFKFSNIRGSSKSNYVTLKELVKEKLHSKQYDSSYSSYGHGYQNIQNFIGELEQNQSRNTLSLNIKVICFGMVEEYALICLEDESYKEKFSSQFQKNSFLISILSDLITKQKIQFQNIHQNLSVGIEAITNQSKNLQNILSRIHSSSGLSGLQNNFPKTFLDLSKNTLIQQNPKCRSLFSTDQVLLTNTSKFSPIESPIVNFSKIELNFNQQQKQLETQKNDQQDCFEGVQSEQNQDQKDESHIQNKGKQQNYENFIQNTNYSSFFNLMNGNMNESKPNYRLNDLNISELELNKTNKQFIDNLTEQKEIWNINDNKFDQSFDDQKQSTDCIPSELKGNMQFPQSPQFISFSQLNLRKKSESYMEQNKMNIFRERIKNIMRLRNLFLKLYSHVSQMKLQIMNLDTYIKNERKINCQRRSIQLIKLVHEIISLYRYQIESRNIKIIFQNNYASACIYQDIEMLYIILQNIISNSIEYNTHNEGEIEIKIEEATTDIVSDNNKYVRITIKNTIPHIEEQFVLQKNNNFQKIINKIYFGLDRESLQLNQLRNEKYQFGLRIAQKNIRNIGPYNKIDIHFTSKTCEASFLVYADINVLEHKNKIK